MDPIVLVAVIVIGTRVVHRVMKKFVLPVLRSKFKGVAGERAVHRILRRAGKELGAHERFRDIMIPGKHQTAQLDNGLITRYGIFMVETKNYSGEVLGDDKEPMWSHRFAGGSRQELFYNPVMQNKGHIEALKMLLKKYPGIPIYNIVAFSDNCKVSPPDLTNVVYFSNLNAAIQVRAGDEPVLSEDQVKDIKDIIEKANISGRRDREEHVTKASLAASGARHGLDPDFIKTLEEGKKQPVVSFSSPYADQPVRKGLSPEQIQLSDEGALLRINGKTGSIDDFFEQAKRDIHDMPVPHGAPFDHFICPYTGTSFPVSEAKGFYNGLWAAYLSGHPELVSYMHEKGVGGLQSSFRTGRLLASYVEDEEAFKAAARDTAWYRNLQAYQAKKHNSLNEQISKADGQRPISAAKGKTCQGYTH